MHDTNEIEMVDIVDKNDNIIGTTLKTDVYKKGLSNRIVHVFVIHPDSGAIFIQKRSATVRYLPNHYCTSAGGHVRSGENYDTAALREMEEEIGLSTGLHFIEKFIYNCPETSPATPRFISLYVTYATRGFNLAKEEVSEGFFITTKEFEKILDKDNNLHPQLSPCYEVYRKSRYFLHQPLTSKDL